MERRKRLGKGFRVLRHSALLLFFAATASSWADTYDPAASFEAGFKSHSNPNGVWSYGYSSGFTSAVTLYSQVVQGNQYVQGNSDSANLQLWVSPSANQSNSPAVEFNNGPAFNNGNNSGVNILANQLLLVSGVGGQYSDLVFTAPSAGVYSIAASFRGDQYGIGVVVGIVANGGVTFSSKVTSEGQTVPFNGTVALATGSTVVFSVGPGGGLQNTGLAATVTGPLGAPPAVSSVVNDASFAAGAISTGSWVAIFGTGLAPAGDSRTWNAATEIVNGNLPVSLDGTSVTVNGKPAVVEFISPSQVNIQPPDDTAVGPVQVVVTTMDGGSSTPFTVNYAEFAPGLFPAASPYIVAQHGDNSYLTPAAPAKPGEVIILWGTGFGPANPSVPAGQVFSGASPLANTATVTIGGQPAAVDFAGVVGAGLVQINVHVPISINNGDAAVVATVGGASTQTSGNMISIQN